MHRSKLRSIISLAFKYLSHVHACGLENIPATGGCILAANHLGRLDPPLIFSLLDREDVTGLVADKYKKYFYMRWLIGIVDGIWINREDADFRALREARQFLRAGGILGIAPEGTRSRAGALIPAKTGIAYLADKAEVPILPVAIYGTENAISQLLRLRRPHIHIRFGSLLNLPPIRREQRETDLRRNTDEIMCHLAAMLPPDYRGVYHDHPRLPELLLENPSYHLAGRSNAR